MKSSNWTKAKQNMEVEHEDLGLVSIGVSECD